MVGIVSFLRMWNNLDALEWIVVNKPEFSRACASSSLVLKLDSITNDTATRVYSIRNVVSLLDQ